MALSDRTTVATLRVMKLFVDHFNDDALVFGGEIIETLGLPSGTVYPILQRFEGFGWIEGEKESPAAEFAGRPRIYYKLTPGGLAAMRSELEEARDLIGDET